MSTELEEIVKETHVTSFMEITGISLLTRYSCHVVRLSGRWRNISMIKAPGSNNYRQFRCDEKLQRLFKRDKLNMRTMKRLLSEHLFLNKNS